MSGFVKVVGFAAVMRMEWVAHFFALREAMKTMGAVVLVNWFIVLSFLSKLCLDFVINPSLQFRSCNGYNSL